MHGTGTPLGDPIEVGAICDAFIMIDCSMRGFALHAVKSILGHAETSAGALGLLQASVSLINARSFPLTHLRTLNLHISSTLQRFYIFTKADGIVCPSQDSQLAILCPPGCKVMEFPSTRYQMSGTSSLAFQGTNAHALVVKEYCRSKDESKNLRNQKMI